jgi:hypothetical protein
MRLALWLSFTALVASISVRDARAEWPHINSKLRSGQGAIHKVVILPAQVDYKKIRFEGAEPRTEESDRIAGSLYSAVSKELSLRGVEVLPNPLEAARTDAERYVIADLETRYDTVGVQIRKRPGLVEQGQATLDDRVATFAPGAGSDTLVFIRGNGADRLPPVPVGRVPFRAEVAFVDSKTGEVLALVRFSSLTDVANKTDGRLASGFREALHDLPLPAPPPKK